MTDQILLARAGAGRESPRHVRGFEALRVAALVGLDPIEGMRHAHARYGSLAKFVLGPGSGKLGSRYIFAVGAPYNEQVLGDPATFHPCGVLIPGPRGSAQRRIRNGLLTARGAQHAHYRRLMLPPLRRTAVDQRAARMGEVVDALLDGWPTDRTVDLFPLVSDVALHVALKTLFPTDGDGMFDEALGVAAMMTNHFRMNASLAVKACPVNAPGLPYARMLRHSEAIETGLAAWARKNTTEGRSDSLLSILAHAPNEKGDPPCEATVSGQLITLFGASYETSQSGLAWALLLLAQHPAVAARLLDEIEALPDDGAAFTDQIGDCVWLDAVVKESLRLLPPVPMQIRRTDHRAELVDCAVEAGDYVLLSPFLTNRDPDRYPDPDRFRPERWRGLDPSQYEYLVFSAGPRLCIGARFAVTFLKVAIAHIIRRYRLRIAPQARIDQTVSLTMTPVKSGILASIHAQDGRFEASPIRGNIRRIVAGISPRA